MTAISKWGTVLTKLGTLFAYIIMVYTNYLAVTLPIAGRDTGAISDSYPNLFAPAGYTFSIWGIIYLLLGAYVLYQLFQKNTPFITKINQIFIINALLNAAWIFAWHYDFILISVIIMLGLLVSLISIGNITSKLKFTSSDGFFLRLPFSVYLGWITVATIANITVFLVGIKWSGWGLSELFWMVLILFVGAAIGLWRAIKYRDIPYALVLVWAYGGILSKHLSASGFSGQYPMVIFSTSLCILFFISSIVFLIVKPEKNKKINPKKK